MRIAVCGDVQADRETIIKNIRQYCSEQLWDCHIDEYNKEEEFLLTFTQSSYQIVFLDIYSTGKDGVECAKKIRSLDKDVILILITPIDSSFEEGYKLGVKNYIEKPIEDSSVRSCIRRSSRDIGELRQTVEIITENTPVKISLQDIHYIENIKNICLIHTSQFLIKTNKTLNDLEKQLDNKRFLRSHQSYLVNMDAITKKTEGAFCIKNGEEIPICMSEKNKILEAFLEYQLENVKR